MPEVAVHLRRAITVCNSPDCWCLSERGRMSAKAEDATVPTYHDTALTALDGFPAGFHI